MQDVSTDQLLKTLGLQRARSAVEILMTTSGLVAAGVLAGVGIGMLIAPKSGREIRNGIRHRLADARGRVSRNIDALENKVGAKVEASRSPGESYIS